MDSRTIFRLRDIVDAVDQIEILLKGKTVDLLQERTTKAAFERFLEILAKVEKHQ